MPRLEAWIRGQINAMHNTKSVLAVHPHVLAVHCVSAAKSYGIRDLVATLRRHKGDIVKSGGAGGSADAFGGGGDVYVVGAPNSGKSTLINAVMAEVWDVPMPQERKQQASSGGPSFALGGTVPAPLAPVDDPEVLDPAAVAAALKRRTPAPSQQLFSVTEIAEARAALPRKALPRTEAGGGAEDEEEALIAELEKCSAAPRLPLADSAVAGAEPLGRLHLSAEEDSLLDSVLLSHTSRQAAHLRRKAPQFPDSPAMISPVPEGSGRTEISAAPSKPVVPFTTSPLPGTTLGLIGAQLDPHGHSRIWDTPGLVVSAHKQALLEAVATQQAAVRMLVPGQRPLPPPRRGGGGGRSAAHRVEPPHAGQAASGYATYKLAPGRSLFLGGLARVDYAQVSAVAAAQRVGPSDPPALLVTVCSHLPVHTTRTDLAASLWDRHRGGGEGDGEGGALLLQKPATEIRTEGGLSQAPLLSPSYGPLLHTGAVSLLSVLSSQQMRAVAATEALLTLRHSAEVGSESASSSSHWHDRRAEEEACEAALVRLFPPPPVAWPLLLKAAEEEEEEEVEGKQRTLAAMRDEQAASEARLETLVRKLLALETAAAQSQGGLRRGRPTARGSYDVGAPQAAPASALLRAWAAAHGAGGEATQDRRRRRARRNLLDVAFGGLGWVSVTPLAVEGMWGWARTVSRAVLGVAVARGVSVHARRPLLADTASGLTAAEWIE